MEFWSSVEYGTFLKGLVRELGGEGSTAKVECRMQSEEVGGRKTQLWRDAKTEAAVPPRSGRPETRSSKPDTAGGGMRGIENRLGPATVLP